MSKDTPSMEELIKALEANGGIVSRAAESLGMTRIKLHKLIIEHEELRKARDEARAVILDLAEGVLYDVLAKQDRQAAIYVLNTIGRERGYGNVHTINHTSSDGSMSPTRDLSEKELRNELRKYGVDLGPIEGVDIVDDQDD